MYNFDLSAILPPNRVAVALRNPDDAVALCTAIKEELPDYAASWNYTSIKYVWGRYHSDTCISLTYKNQQRLLRGPTRDFVNAGCKIIEISDIELADPDIEDSDLDVDFLFK